MKKTIKHTDYEVEKVDWRDFMENDNNPTLVRLTNQLVQDPEFRAILVDNGYNFDEEEE